MGSWRRAIALGASIGIAVVAGLDVPAGATAPARNGRIVFTSHSSGNSELYAMDVDGRRLANLATNTGNEFLAMWSPDGTKIAFSSTREPCGTYVMNADGSDTHLVIAGWEPDGWSPDGLRVVVSNFWICSANATDAPDAFAVNVDGTGLTPLLAGPSWQVWPSWSPDGQRLIYKQGHTDADGIYIAAANGAAPRLLVADTSQFWFDKPSFSPDGQTIVFFGNNRTTNDMEVFAVAIDGTGLRQLTSTPGRSAWPRYAPDGTRILIVTDGGENTPSMLATIKPDGSDRRVVPGSDGAEFADWQRVDADSPSTSTTRATTSASTPTSRSAGAGTTAQTTSPSGTVRSLTTASANPGEATSVAAATEQSNLDAASRDDRLGRGPRESAVAKRRPSSAPTGLAAVAAMLLLLVVTALTLVRFRTRETSRANPAQGRR
jgi:Tol biopolymer transport system component